MKLYCGNCGKQLHITRKALKGMGIIVDVVDYHECSEVLRSFDSETEKFIPVAGKDTFLKELDNVKPSKAHPQVATASDQAASKERRSFPMQGTDDLRDRRLEKPIISTAPNSIADQIRRMSNSIPANEARGIDEGTKGSNDSVEIGD